MIQEAVDLVAIIWLTFPLINQVNVYVGEASQTLLPLNARLVIKPVKNAPVLCPHNAQPAMISEC